MQQFISLKANKKVTLQQLHEILSQRFPSYEVYIHNKDVRIRKNALVTASVEIKTNDDKTIISIGTKTRWWIWLLLGWLQLIVKRGIVDEIYASLLRDLHLSFPDCVSLPDTSKLIAWKKATKPLKVLSAMLLVWTLCFCYWAQYIISIAFNGYMFPRLGYRPEIMKIYQDIEYFASVVPSVFWLIMGCYLTRLKIKNIKYAGFFIISFCLCDFFNAVLYVLLSLCDIKFINIPYYVYIRCIIMNLLMFSAGCFLNKNIYNGALRHASIALKMLALSGFFSSITIIVLKSIFINNDLSSYEDAYIRNIIIIGVALVFWPFSYAAYFCLYRAFHKLPKYPV